MRQDVSLFSLSNHGQIGIPMTVLESACPEDSETPPVSCNLWFLNHFFIKFKNQGQFKHLLFMGIQNLSLIFNFDKEMIDKPKVTDNFVSIVMKRCQFLK